MSRLTELISLNAKNWVGWRTRRRIVVFSVDDYGNVRIASPQAKEKMQLAGLNMSSRFDQFDNLENETDLLQLFDTLSSVKDSSGKHALFTAFALPVNIDFERVEASGFSEFHYELLPITFSKLRGYEGVYNLWKQGMASKLLVPQFHGREHLNLKLFKELLAAQNKELLVSLQNRSFAGLTSSYPTISYTAAFDFEKPEENAVFHDIVRDGLNAFEKVFGVRAIHFNSPGGRENPAIHDTLKREGVRYLDAPLLKSEHQGYGRYKRIFNYTGKTNKAEQTILVRNCVFEPTVASNVDCVAFAERQIEAAFRWNRPAIISSHRVNFGGGIDPKNRDKGLHALGRLLKRIVHRWPEVEFMSANELGDLVSGNKQHV